MKNEEIIEKLTYYVSEDDFVYDSIHGRWYTYRELWEIAYVMGDSINQRGYKTVIAVMNNGFDLFALYFACMLSNTTIVPIDPRKSRKEIENIISEHDNYLLLEDDSYLFSVTIADIDTEEIKQAIRAVNLTKAFIITYTSGSTGHAKGVVHNLRNLFLASASFGKATGLDNSYTMCHVMPMTYMAGILNTIIMPLFCGTKIVLLRRFDVMSAVRFWKNAEKLNVTAFWLSPTMLNVLMTLDKKGKAKEYLYRSSTLFFVGTAPLSENTRRRFETTYGVKLLQSYGLSETLFISTETPQEENDIKSVGTILPNVKIGINEAHEILICVPWMFLGYTNENTADYFIGDQYKSGDIGRVDHDNRLFITGRIKDLIVKGGMNISPTQIEKCLLQCERIVECAVAGVTVNDEENIVCWYVLRPGTDLSLTAVNEFLDKELGRYCRIDFFRRKKNIPKNLNGKVDKKKLVQEFSP